MKVLVINNSHPLIPYVEKYQLFTEWTDAIKAAKAIGWEDPMGMGVNKKIGISNTYGCGEIDVMIIGLEEQ